VREMRLHDALFLRRTRAKQAGLRTPGL
jgi:hypothetical protein